MRASASSLARTAPSPNPCRGQYIRSVDFNGPAHKWGLAAGDRILEVNGEPCAWDSHEEVIQLIKKSGDAVRLEVVKDPTIEGTALEATTTLLGERDQAVIVEATGIPQFTVEMTNCKLGRTRMLTRSFAGSPEVEEEPQEPPTPKPEPIKEYKVALQDDVGREGRMALYPTFNKKKPAAEPEPVAEPVAEPAESDVFVEDDAKADEPVPKAAAAEDEEVWI